MSAATLIGALSVVSAILGILNKRLLVGQFSGAERPLLDAFFAAFRVPDFLFQLLVVGVLSATFIPVYTRLMDREKRERDVLVWTLMTVLGLSYAVIALIVCIFAVPIIRSFTGSQFTTEQVLSSAALMRVMLVAQFFFLISNFLSGILQSNKRFLLPALSPIMYNLGIILGTVLLSPYFGIYGPAIGVVIGAVAHLMIQLPLSFRFGFSYKPKFALDDINVREVMRLMVPRGATQSTNALEDFVGVYIATSFGNTLLAIRDYAFALVAAPVRFFGISIAQAALPFLSLEAKDPDVKGFTQLLMKTLHQIAFFMFPAGVLLLILRIPIVRLAFGARELPWSDTVLLGRLVAIYSISVGATAMIHVVLRAYYALRETKTPFFIALASMVVNIVLMWICAYGLGLSVYAIPIGFTAAGIFELLMLLGLLFRRLHMFNWIEFFLPQIKLIVAAALMGVSLYVPMKYLDQMVFDTTRTLGLIALTGIASCIGLLVYLIFCRLLSVEQLSIVASIRGRIEGSLSRLSRNQEVIGVEGEQNL